MKKYLYPEKNSWDNLCKRPAIDKSNLEEQVREILNRVRSGSDEALHFFSEKFDGIPGGNLKVSLNEIEDSVRIVPEELKKAINIAKANIEKFHSAQLLKEDIVETTKGVRCWRKSVAIEKIGLYIPGGSAPLFSTVLMLGIPARLSGCKEIILCTPSGKDGKINP